MVGQMIRGIAQVVASEGFVLLPKYRLELDTRAAIEEIGVVSIIDGISDIQQLRPHSMEAMPPNTYSGNYGLGAFPLHTDLAHWHFPPRYLVLRCLNGAANTPTQLFDGNRVVDILGWRELTRAIAQPRRPLNGKRHLLRLLQENPDYGRMLRWDSIYLRPATKLGLEIFAEMKSMLAAASIIQLSLAHPGDTLIIDNWRMLHGRSTITTSQASRLVERMYLGALK